MSGFDATNSGFNGIVPGPAGVPNPTRKATQNSTLPFVYSRRYLDWNRRTLEYHAATWYDQSFDYNNGLAATAEITKYRQQLNLSAVYGCVPQVSKYINSLVPLYRENVLVLYFPFLGCPGGRWIKCALARMLIRYRIIA